MLSTCACNVVQCLSLLCVRVDLSCACVFVRDQEGSRVWFCLLGQPGGIALNTCVFPENVSYVFFIIDGSAFSSAFGEAGVHSLPETIQRCLHSIFACMANVYAACIPANF